MNLFASLAMLALMPPPPAGTAPNPTGQMLQMVGTLLVMGLLFYFVLIRPQQKKSKEHVELLKALKPGDKIVTSGGILGIVVAVKDRSVSIRSADTKLEVLKSAVSEITERAAASSES